MIKQQLCRLLVGRCCVPADQILSLAMSLVGNAREEILVTMDLAEELTKPLPTDYFHLLGSRMKEGVRLVRAGFGTEEDAHAFEERVPVTFATYKFFRVANGTVYQRMMLADRQNLLYAVDTRHGRRFFSSSRKGDARTFLQYFERLG
ncbi:hypothetical protein HYW18_01070 [Candidatus Uhrbacteria bacterium]|nr:hypothetical protein [Candidatus Uhrbacteria bacterium]